MAGSSQNSDDGEISGINVTPLVDVMLVLLIIFMVTAKYIEHEAIPVDLPKAANGGSVNAKTLIVAITDKGRMYVDGVEMSDATLVTMIGSGKYGKKEDLQVVIGADKDAHHGAVIHLLDILKQNDVSKFAFEIDKPT